MSVEVLPQEEVKALALSFLKSHSAKVKANPEYLGEMITAAHLAMLKYDPKYEVKPSTFIYTYCRNRLYLLLKRDKLFYSKHEFGHVMENFKSRENNPFKEVSFYEQSKILSESGLTKRCQQIILERMRYPEETMKQLGERLGISKQAVSQHINSAKQYFERNNVNIQLYEDD